MQNYGQDGNCVEGGADAERDKANAKAAGAGEQIENRVIVSIAAR